MNESELNDLAARAHTDHGGNHIWVDVKVGQRKRQFVNDLFLERKLPFAQDPDAPDDPAYDIVDTGSDETTPKKRRQKRKEFEFDKDAPSFSTSVEEDFDPSDFLQNLSDEELRTLLEEALEQMTDGSVSDDSEFGKTIEKTSFAISVIIASASEISAWLPATLLAEIGASAGFFALEAFVGVIGLPLVGWVALTIEFRSSTEAHRNWGIRTAMREGKFALKRLAHKFAVGPIPSRPIRNWITSSEKAVAIEVPSAGPHLPVDKKFHEGYDFVAKELTTLANGVLDEVEKVVYKKFSEIGLSDTKIEIVLESGLVNLNKVYSKALNGLADYLNEELRKIEKT